MRTFILSSLFLLLAGCAERDRQPRQENNEQRPDQESWDVELAIEVDGRPRARLAAPYVARYEGTDSTFARFSPTEQRPDRIHVLVFDDAGELSATVEADRMDHYENRRMFVATGQVVVTNETGRRLEGERLIWHEADREIRSDGFVRITTPTERLQGYSLVADESLETYRLARITGQVEVEDS